MTPARSLLRASVVMALMCLSVIKAHGQAWMQIGTLPPGTDLRCAYFWDSQHGVVGGVRCIYTYTFGVWREASYPEGPDTIKSLRLLDGFNLYAASGVTCVWKSSDRGATWQKTSALLPNADDINVGEDGLIHGVNLNGTGMSRGTTIARINPNVSNFCIAARDAQNLMGWSPDGGVTWNLSSPPTLDCGYTCVADTCSGICYTLTRTPKVVLYQSTDRGVTWSDKYDFFNFAVDIIDGGNSGVLYVQGTQNVWRSLSGGARWSSIGGPGSDLTNRRMFAFGQYNRFLIQMDSNLVYLWDGGTSYHPTGPMPTVLSVSNVIDTNCTFTQLTVKLIESGLPARVRILAHASDSSTIQPADTTIVLPAGGGTVLLQYRTTVPLQQHGAEFYFEDTVTGTYDCGPFEYTEDDSMTVQMPTYPTNILRVNDLTDTGCSLSNLSIYFEEIGNPDTVRVHAYTNDGLSIEPADTIVIVPKGNGWFPVQYKALPHPFQFATTFHFEDTVSGAYKCGQYKYVTDSSILVHLYPPRGTPHAWLKPLLKFDACTETRIPIVIRAPNICDSLTIDSITWTNNSLSFQFDHQPPETLGPDGLDTFWVTLSTPIPGINNNYFYIHTTSTVLPHSWDTGLYLYALASAGPAPPRITAVQNLTLSNCKESMVPFYLHALSCDSVRFTSCTLSLSSPLLHSTNFNVPLELAAGTDDTLSITFPPQGYSGVTIVTAEVKGKYLGSQVTFDTTVQIRVTFTNAVSALSTNITGVDFGTINLCDGSGEGDTTVTFTNFGCDTITVTGDQTSWQFGWSVTEPMFPLTLPPDSSFKASIHFNPTGQASVNLTMIYGFEYEGGKTGITQIGLTGQAVVAGVASLSMSSASVNFGTFSQCGNPVSDTTITITNTGCDSLSVHWAFVGAHSGFTLQNGSDTILGHNQSASFTIHFADSVPSAFNGAITLTGVGVHGGSMIDTTISLAAIITPATKLASINTTAIDFGTTPICEERDSFVTITNKGCETDTIVSASFSNMQFAFDTIFTFPIILLPDSAVTFPIFTHLDTAGHPATIAGTLNFIFGAGLAIPTITLTRSVTYPGAFSLWLASEASAPIKAIVPVYILRNGVVPSQANEVDFNLIYDDNVLGNGAATEPDIKLGTQTRLANGLLDQSIAMQPASDRDTIATLQFLTYLTKNDSTSIQLTHPQFIANGAISPSCVAVMDTSSNPSNFQLELTCGDSIILAAWNYAPPFSIESVQPNPAGDEIRVQLSGNVQPYMELYDALGRTVSIPPSSLNLHPSFLSLDVSQVPTGSYFLRFSFDGYVQTRRILVER